MPLLDGLLEYHLTQVQKKWELRHAPKIKNELREHFENILSLAKEDFLKKQAEINLNLLNAMGGNGTSEQDESLHFKDNDKWIVTVPKITFEDIVGYEDIKENIINNFIFLYRYPREAEKLRLEPPSACNLIGPPGCGKTSFAMAIANELKKPLVYVEPSTILSHYFSRSTTNLRSALNLADDKNAVILIDEAEQILGKRTGEIGRLLATVMLWLEGVKKKKKGSLLITASNQFWKYDSALLRREFNYFIPPPNLDERKKLFELGLKNLPTENLDIGYFAEISENFVGSDIVGPTGVIQKVKMKVWSDFLKVRDDSALIIKMTAIEEVIKNHKLSLPKWCMEAKRSLEKDSSLQEIFPEVVDFLKTITLW